MKKTVIGFVCVAILAIAFTLLSANPVSATPAQPEKGKGCAASNNFSNYFYEPNCEIRVVIKYDDAGKIVFYDYHDHAKLPDGLPRPDRAINRTYEKCFQLSYGTFCGKVNETITPSGEYMSSFKIH